MGKMRVKASRGLVLFTNGQVLIGKFQWLLSLLIFLKIFDFPRIYYYILLPLMAVVTVFTGYLYERLGIRKIFEEENSKYVIRKIKEEKERL